MKKEWTKSSWRNFPIKQQPEWPDKEQFKKTISELKKLPSLVFSGETRQLKQKLIDVNKENRFILQVGNCAESFEDCNGPKIHNLVRIILQMALILRYKSDKKIIKIGRIAGQYAKPRSSNYETINNIKIPCYRGDTVNSSIPVKTKRIPNPKRLLDGYFRSAATLNLIRAFTQGGYNEVNNLSDWKKHFFSDEISNTDYYKKFEKDLTNSLKEKEKILHHTYEGDQIYISHEALLLDYEEVFTRIDTVHGGYFDTSAHTVWIGDRTKQHNGAHIEFISGIGNPLGLKVGPNYNLEELIKIIKKINPDKEPGKIMLISRMGHEKIKTELKPLLKAIKRNMLEVILICDPMHGNTFTHNDSKIRDLNDITSEIKSFFEICKAEKIIPGGIHLEITDENVTECIGGINKLNLSNINENYLTKVDPRLNASQALEIAFLVGELLENY